MPPRNIKTTDPNGNVTYTVHNDAAQETRVYSGWNYATNTPTGPTQVYRQDRPDSFSESLTMSAPPDVDGNGRPTGTEPISNIESLYRTYTNDGGQVIYSDAYFSLDGMSYPDAGSKGVNFLRTEFAYDDRGRQHRMEDTTGTVQRTVYDALGRTASTWIGTNDTVTGQWSPTNPGNLLKTSESIYDNGGVGDGNLTAQRVFADDTLFYETLHQYDFRNRRIGTRRPDLVAVDQVFNNLGQTIESNTYTDSNDNFALDLDNDELRAKSETEFDDQGRPYLSRSYEVDQTTGELGNVLTSQTWYNKRGQTVKTENANGLFSKTLYDGAGRTTHQFVSFDLDETSWSEALDVNGDTVIEQSQSIYDPGSRVVAGLSFQRFEDDTTTVGLLDGTNSYRNASVTWYDIGDRVTHSATFGRDDGPSDRYVFALSDDSIIDADADGIPDEAEGTPRQPDTSDDYIVSKTEYDSSGRGHRTIDNLGRVTRTDFDLLGRTVRMIQNYVDGIVTETETDTDVTVEYDYDAAGRMVTLRARNPKGTGNGVENQETRYLHESPINASWVTNEIYPDSSDVDSTGTDQIKFTHDRLGRRVTMTDQRGVEHTFDYDAAGRMEADRITNLGASGIVDDSILRIERSYDDMSRVAMITSYDAASVVNQVEFLYNGYGLVSQSKQEQDGAVDANTLSVKYNYDDGATGGEAKYVRLALVEYPNGRLVHYIYPTTDVGAVLSRVEAIADDPDELGGGLPTVTLAEYSYLGAGTIVEVRHPDVTGGLTLSFNATGNYEGWDRFGRVVNQQWTDAAGTTTFDQYQYTYDRNSNRTSRSNVLNTALSETYGYDGLDRLVDADRDGSDLQDWGLDALGNWNDFTDQGSTVTRTHNAANELTDIDTSGVIDPAYDAAGNMISGPKPDNPTERQHYKWDAWNRLVEVLDDDGSGNPGTTIAEFEYDGRNYRVQKTAGGVLQAFFHNEAHQVLEVRKDGDADPAEQYIWDLRYIDAPVVRFHDANADGTIDDTLYYANDANMNVTALINATSGDVVERYHYDPYGKVQVYDGLWALQAGSSLNNNLLFTGRYLDAETGLFYYRARYYDFRLGRFFGRDPIRYWDGWNLYGYVRSGPLGNVDPLGLASTTISAPQTKSGVLVAGYEGGLGNAKPDKNGVMARLFGSVNRKHDIYVNSPEPAMTWTVLPTGLKNLLQKHADTGLSSQFSPCIVRIVLVGFSRGVYSARNAAKLYRDEIRTLKNNKGMKADYEILLIEIDKEKLSTDPAHAGPGGIARIQIHTRFSNDTLTAQGAPTGIQVYLDHTVNGAYKQYVEGRGRVNGKVSIHQAADDFFLDQLGIQYINQKLEGNRNKGDQAPLTGGLPQLISNFADHGALFAPK